MVLRRRNHVRPVGSDDAAQRTDSALLLKCGSPRFERPETITARMSATSTSIGLPATVPPKSNTAILAASTEPWPALRDAKLVRSVSTPILTDFSPAQAADAASNANRTISNYFVAMHSAEFLLGQRTQRPGPRARRLRGRAAR